MTLQLENVVITGRTFEEYSSFFDLKIEDLKLLVQTQTVSVGESTDVNITIILGKDK